MTKYNFSNTDLSVDVWGASQINSGVVCFHLRERIILDITLADTHDVSECYVVLHNLTSESIRLNFDSSGKIKFDITAACRMQHVSKSGDVSFEVVLWAQDSEYSQIDIDALSRDGIWFGGNITACSNSVQDALLYARPNKICYAQDIYDLSPLNLEFVYNPQFGYSSNRPQRGQIDYQFMNGQQGGMGLTGLNSTNYGVVNLVGTNINGLITDIRMTNVAGDYCAQKLSEIVFERLTENYIKLSWLSMFGSYKGCAWKLKKKTYGVQSTRDVLPIAGEYRQEKGYSVQVVAYIDGLSRMGIEYYSDVIISSDVRCKCLALGLNMIDQKGHNVQVTDKSITLPDGEQHNGKIEITLNLRHYDLY